MSLSYILFFILGIIAIASGIITISSRHPVTSAMALIVHFFMLAALYLNLKAQLLAVLEVLIYAGAIMVLVIFVIMLLNLGDEGKIKEKFNYRVFITILFAIVLLVQFGIIFYSGARPSIHRTIPADIGTVQSIGKELFTGYLLPFEAVSLLLLTAIVGSIVLAKRKVD
jgi:NADH-quinone oxidoreductase subunit J